MRPDTKPRPLLTRLDRMEIASCSLCFQIIYGPVEASDDSSVLIGKAHIRHLLTCEWRRPSSHT